MDRRSTQICANYKSNWRNFQHSTCKYGSNHRTRVRSVRKWYSHKIFSSPTIVDNHRLACEVELSSTSQASRRCPRPCRQLCPRYVGGIWETGFSEAKKTIKWQQEQRNSSKRTEQNNKPPLSWEASLYQKRRVPCNTQIEDEWRHRPRDKRTCYETTKPRNLLLF